MNAVIIVSIVFTSLVLIFGILAGTILTIIKMRHGGVSRKGRKRYDEETKMIQEIFHNLSKMEKRVESLETILMEGKDKTP